MKYIVRFLFSLFIGIVLGGGFLYAQGIKMPDRKSKTSTSQIGDSGAFGAVDNNGHYTPNGGIKKTQLGNPKDYTNTFDENNTSKKDAALKKKEDAKNKSDAQLSNNGISCSSEQLAKGICRMSVEGMIGMRVGTPDTTPTEFMQDITLALTTFIGTMLTLALIVSGLMIIFGGANENTASRGRSGIKYALIGYAIVLSSYAIIRLVQYITSG